MLTKQEKKELVKELEEKAKSSKSMVFCDYKGVTVSQMSDLRSKLRESDSQMQVAKKSLIQIALQNAGIEVKARELEGQLAVAFSNDEVAAPKATYEFAKDNENFKILAGSLGVQVLSQTEVTNLAQVPSKPELLAKMVGSMKSPISGLANVLAGNMRGLVGALNAIKEKKV